MFSQFRMQYPQGSLISEFVTVDHGKYVVRVEVQDKGVTLATGLAAAETVEAAEDRARIRALAVIGITVKEKDQGASASAYGIPSNQDTAPMDFAKKMPPSLASSTYSKQSYKPSEPYQTQPRDLPKVEVSQESIPQSPINTTNTTTTSQDFLGEEFTSHTTQMDFPEPMESVSLGENVVTSSTKTQFQSSSYTSKNKQEEAPIMEDISQEMKRLGWSTSQGRKHLIETYGKRTRSHLTDLQLQEFLEYLQSLE